MSDSLARFQQGLGIEFADENLLKLALTHRSFGKKNNERLEFLGDAVLGYIISEKIFSMYPEAAEGDLSRLRSSMVRKETLAELARANGFADIIKLGLSELKSGGSNRDSVLADSFEALIGALLLDKNIDHVRQYLLVVYKEKLESMPEIDILKDAKTRLQELLQARKMSLPEYVSVNEKTDHPQEFTVLCKIAEFKLETTATSTSKRKAEQLAASMMLEKIENAEAN